VDIGASEEQFEEPEGEEGESEGEQPDHGVTSDRRALRRARYALTSAVFAVVHGSQRQW
jgi:hypothetical protein